MLFKRVKSEHIAHMTLWRKLFDQANEIYSCCPDTIGGNSTDVRHMTIFLSNSLLSIKELYYKTNILVNE